MNVLSYIDAEISLTINMERKKKGHIQGNLNRRVPVLNPIVVEISLTKMCRERNKDI